MTLFQNFATEQERENTLSSKTQNMNLTSETHSQLKWLQLIQRIQVDKTNLATLNMPENFCTKDSINKKRKKQNKTNQL